MLEGVGKLPQMPSNEAPWIPTHVGLPETRKLGLAKRNYMHPHQRKALTNAKRKGSPQKWKETPCNSLKELREIKLIPS